MHLSVGKGLQHSSGRIISLGRLMLATLFLAAILVDASQPSLAPRAAYAILGSYILFAAAVAAATWRNWWLDAKLAGPAHAVDITLFMLLVLLTEGYTSPFFTFFIFVLLSAAIRWNWRATALTAVLLVLLYLLVGLVGVLSGGDFSFQRFLVRTGQLLIVSLTLIWFGANQRWARIDRAGMDFLPHPSLDEVPQEAALRSAMTRVGAADGVLLWREQGREMFSGLTISDVGVSISDVPEKAVAKALDAPPFLYDCDRHRALRKDAERNVVYFDPGELISTPPASLSLSEGLAIPVNSDRGEGILFLQGIRNLSTDHVELGERMAAEIVTHVQRHALLKAAEENAEARSRLTLARDLHDSVVQFLAGAAFRLEAMKRSTSLGRDLEPDLNELKQLMLQEQRELRSFITSLRSGPLAAFNELAKDLESLAERLSRQWDVNCEFSARRVDMMIPTRLRLDAHQLMREAVANAVRHAAAKSITVKLAAASDQLRLEFINDGAEFRKRGGRLELPASLKERVDLVGGSISMARGMGVTKLSISLPIGELNR